MAFEAVERQGTASSRLDILDGLRGVAALMVVIYHFTSRWSSTEHITSLYPYGDVFIDGFPPLLHFGTIGVYLFFLISGFVIILTLERCSGMLDFIGRRISRLWPTMLVCATLTTLIVSATGIHARFPGTDYWQVEPLEYLASIFFIDPALISRATGIEDLRWVDGVYWTLWAEVRFYAVIAAAFWLTPRRYFLSVWFALQAISLSLSLMTDPPLVLDLIFQPGLLAWFTLGLCGYYLWKQALSRTVVALAVIALLDLLLKEVIDIQGGIASDAVTWLAIYAVIFAPFILFLVRSPVLKPLTSPWVVTIGLASYPLYMFHERVGIIATTYLSDWGLPPLLAMAVTIPALIGFAILLSRCLETPAKSLMLKYWKPFANTWQAKIPFLRFVDR